VRSIVYGDHNLGSDPSILTDDVRVEGTAMARWKHFDENTIGRLGTKFRVGVLSATLALGAVGGVVALPTAPAMAGGCNSGTWGGVNGWGDCQGIGGGKWRLKVSCTWGQSSTSAVLTGDGHVDVTCPLGTDAQTASIIRL
jgi:hypothetical protein